MFQVYFLVFYQIMKDRIRGRAKISALNHLILVSLPTINTQNVILYHEPRMKYIVYDISPVIIINISILFSISLSQKTLYNATMSITCRALEIIYDKEIGRICSISYKSAKPRQIENLQVSTNLNLLA